MILWYGPLDSMMIEEIHFDQVPYSGKHWWEKTLAPFQLFILFGAEKFGEWPNIASFLLLHS